MRRINGIILGLLIIVVGVCGCGKNKNKNKDKENMPIASSTSVSTEATTEYVPVTPATPTDEEKTDADGFVIREDYVKTIEDIVNARTMPETDAPIYRILEKGIVLERTGDNAKWTRVLIDGTPFYVYSEYVAVTETPTPETPNTETASVSDASSTDGIKGSHKVKKIVIDAANQANPDFALEAIGPNSKTEKQCVTAGNVGIALSVKEYEINLVYAKALEQELKNRGYEVVMTRNSDSADISNKQRAELANNSGASVLVRIQMNYSADTKNSGVMAICMTRNTPYNAGLYQDSYELSTRLLQGILENTEAKNRGIFETEELTLVNWSRIPVAVMKLGFLSNVQDEASLASEEYQKKIIEGMADGLDYYFAD